MTIVVSEIAQQRTTRLIPTAYDAPSVLRALVDLDDEAEILARLEGLTSARLGPMVLTAGSDDEAWGQTYIGAAVTDATKGGARFNDGTTRAWYAGFDDRTSLAEVAFHKTWELAKIG